MFSGKFPLRGISQDPLFEPVAELLLHVARTITEPARRQLGDLAVDQKADGSLVTKIDHQAEAILSYHLKRIIPGSQILGEETCQSGDGWKAQLLNFPGFVWVVDPLDGTRPFTQGKDYGIAIALRFNRSTIAAWNYYPSSNKMLFASIHDPNTLHISSVGRPMRLITPIKEIPRRSTAEIVLEVNRGVMPQILSTGVADLFRAVERNSCTTTAVLAMLREGDHAIVNIGSTHPWDQLPAQFLAENAGAVTRAADGGRFKGETYAAAPNPRTMDAVVGALKLIEAGRS